MYLGIPRYSVRYTLLDLYLHIYLFWPAQERQLCGGAVRRVEEAPSDVSIYTYICRER